MRTTLLPCLLLLSVCTLLNAEDPATITEAPPPEVPPAETLPPGEMSVQLVEKDSEPTCPGCCRRFGENTRLGHWWYFHFKPHLQASHWGFPEYFHERPNGSLMQAYMQAQVSNGLVNQLVLYEYDFVGDAGHQGATLNERGRFELRRLARLNKLTGHPVVIQKSGHLELDEARRQAVLQRLAEMHVPVTYETVVVGRVAVTGLGAAGERAMPSQLPWNSTYDNRLQEVLNQGRSDLLPQLIGPLGQ